MRRCKWVFLLLALGLVLGSGQTPATAQETPLHKAVTEGDKELAALLLAKGAKVNAKDNGGWTPLHHAGRLGHRELAELLLAKGAEVNAKDKDGRTPLHHAVFFGQKKEMAELLLAKGADVNAKDKMGATPLDMGQSDEMRALLRKYGAK